MLTSQRANGLSFNKNKKKMLNTKMKFNEKLCNFISIYSERFVKTIHNDVKHESMYIYTCTQIFQSKIINRDSNLKQNVAIDFG